MTNYKLTDTDLVALKTLVSNVADLWARNLTVDSGPTVPPAANPLTMIATPGPGNVLLGWTPNAVKTITGIAATRDGTDTSGAGAWSAPVAPSGRSLLMDKLHPAVAYHFTVTVTYADGTRETATATASPLPLPVTPPTGPATPVGAVKWSSGVWNHGDLAMTLAFEKQRGQKLGNVMVFTSRVNWGAQLSLDWETDSSGKSLLPPMAGRSLVIKIPIWTEDGDTGPLNDWKQLASQVAAVDANAWVCLGWEMNIQSPSTVTPSNVSRWTSQYRFAASTMLATAPGLRLAWNPNAGGDQTGVDSRSLFQTLKDLHTGYGPDSYDTWPPDNTASGRATHLSAKGYLGESYVYAQANGMQFVLPEWGVSSGTANAGHEGGDNPQYITDYMGFLKSRQNETVRLLRGGLVVPAIGFESYFSEPAVYFKSDWASNPKAAAAYAAQFSVTS